MQKRPKAAAQARCCGQARGSLKQSQGLAVRLVWSTGRDWGRGKTGAGTGLGQGGLGHEARWDVGTMRARFGERGWGAHVPLIHSF